MRWHSYHLSTRNLTLDQIDRALTHAVAPFVASMKQEEVVTRFFFIRYWEGGSQLRLRFRTPLSRPSGLCPSLFPALDTALRDYAEQDGWTDLTLESVPYDRSIHYFGPTLASVYAELLNEYTSYLALTLLRQNWPSRSVRAFSVASLLHVLWNACRPAPVDAQVAMQNALDFAASQPLAHVEETRSLTDERWHAVSGAARRVFDQLHPQFQADATVAWIARLMRRTEAYAPRGTFVTRHALHLLCNKMGFGLGDECLIYRLAATLPAPSDRRSHPAARASL